LMATLDEMGEYEIRLQEGYYIDLGRVTNERNQTVLAHTLFAPAYVKVCVSEDNTITSLGVLARTINENELLNVADLVTMYGVPNVVTYTVRPLDRIAFWFEVGISAVVYIGPESAYRYTVHEIYYFPFVNESSFEN